jgi:toxoflavin synthase
MTDDNSYDKIAEQYKNSKKLGFRKYIEEYTLIKLAGDISGKQILDLACGEGIYTRKIKQLGASAIIGVDLSAEMIKLAEEEERKNPIGCQYLVNDALNLGKIGDFDVVMCMYLLNYAQSKEELLQMCEAIYMNLKPNGKLIGFNDNPMNNLENYANYKEYGFIKESTSTRKEGDFVKYVIYNPDGTEFSFNNYYLSPQTYEECFLATGFKNFQWEGPFLDEKVSDTDYWDVFFNDPPLIGFSANK